MAADHLYDRSPAEQFRNFAKAVGDETPLYGRLSEAIIDDEDLLALAGLALAGQPPPNVLFASVQYLLASAISHPLTAWYPAIGGSEPPATDPFPAFRDFCLAHRDELAGLISTRRTQTNEVGRCLALLPALTEVASRLSLPTSLIELGSSAGLLLAFDRYHYTFGERSWGPDASPVRLHTELCGDEPPLPSGLLPITGRLGIDLYPLDVTDHSDVRWLDSLIWPGHHERRARLRHAIDLVAPDPPALVAGDALELLPGAIGAVEAGSVPVVFHSFALIQWTSEQRAALDGLLRDVGRRVLRIWLEWFGYHRNRPLIQVFDYDRGPAQVTTLGRFHHHARWLDWGWTPG